MTGKCEHGLTTSECLVCASPKHGKHSEEPDGPSPSMDERLAAALDALEDNDVAAAVAILKAARAAASKK